MLLQIFSVFAVPPIFPYGSAAALQANAAQMTRQVHGRKKASLQAGLIIIRCRQGYSRNLQSRQCRSTRFCILRRKLHLRNKSSNSKRKLDRSGQSSLKQCCYEWQYWRCSSSQQDLDSRKHRAWTDTANHVNNSNFRRKSNPDGLVHYTVICSGDQQRRLSRISLDRLLQSLPRLLSIRYQNR